MAIKQTSELAESAKMGSGGGKKKKNNKKNKKKSQVPNATEAVSINSTDDQSHVTTVVTATSEKISEAPISPSLETPSVENTEAPSIASAEDPAEGSSEAPVVAQTETPENISEAPATESTEAREENIAPVVSSTDFPPTVAANSKEAANVLTPNNDGANESDNELTFHIDEAERNHRASVDILTELTSDGQNGVGIDDTSVTHEPQNKFEVTSSSSTGEVPSSHGSKDGDPAGQIDQDERLQSVESLSGVPNSDTHGAEEIVAGSAELSKASASDEDDRLAAQIEQAEMNRRDSLSLISSLQSPGSIAVGTSDGVTDNTDLPTDSVRQASSNAQINVEARKKSSSPELGPEPDASKLPSQPEASEKTALLGTNKDSTIDNDQDDGTCCCCLC